MTRAVAWCAAFLGLLCWSPETPASTTDIVDATHPETLVSIIRDLGYRAELESDSEGDPMIRSSVGGTRFSLVFYGCTDSHEACEIVLFKAGWELKRKIGMDVINRWNATRLFGRAYLDDVMDPWIELVLNLRGGVTRAQFESTFEWWENSVGEFEDEIGV